MKIGSREVGPGHPVYIIAELGVNHDGSVERALEMVDAAADAGADAVKMQFFTAQGLVSRACRLAAYQAAAGEADPVAMLRRLEIGRDGMEAVIERSHRRGLDAIVTVFSLELVGAAREMGWDAFKTASPDVINRPLLERVAACGRPLIVSTGAATIDEVRRAMEWLAPWKDRVGVLQCVSSYPAADEDAALGGMVELAGVHDGPIGYSDHTAGEDTGALAARLGACILEKHLTYDRGAKGPDHAASLDAAGFARYVAMVRAERPVAGEPRRWGMAEKFGRGALGPDVRIGPARKALLECEKDVRAVSRQSVTARRGMPAGHVLTMEDLTVKRPGTGIEPFRLEEVVGRRLARDVEGDMPMMWEDLA